MSPDAEHQDLGEKLLLEEYKALFQLTITIEDRILKLFSGTVALVVTFLVTVCGFLFKSENIETDVRLAYLAFGPYLVLIPSFLLLIDLRKDMARIAAYLKVFYEEKVGSPTWLTALTAYKKEPFGDSLDSVPLTYLACAVACCSLFTYALLKNGVRVPQLHFTPLLFAVAVLIPLTRKWREALPSSREYESRWREVRDSGMADVAKALDVRPKRSSTCGTRTPD